MRTLRLAPFALALLAALPGCNRSDGGSGVVAPAATSVAYDVRTDDLRVGVEVPALVPDASGAVLEYTITPPLPAGLSIDPKTGVVSGVPTAAAPHTSYTVRARVTGGVVLTAPIAFEVHADFPAARFAYSLNLFPSSINTWRYDSVQDQLVSAAGLAVEGAPVRIAAHPLGDLVFVLDFERARVLTFAVDPDDGNLEQVDSDFVGPFPLGLSVSSDGRRVVTGSQDRVSFFRVDAVTRRLVASAPPLFVPESVAVEFLPGDDRLALSSTFYEAIGILALDADTGGYAGLLHIVSLPSAYALEVSDDGSRLFASNFAGDVLDTYDLAVATPNLPMLDRIAVPDGTFDIELRDEHLWTAHYGAKALSRFTLGGDGLLVTPAAILSTAGSAPRVRATPGGGYSAPLFDVGVLQRASSPTATAQFQALRPQACDIVLVPAPTGRTRSTPFGVVLDGAVGALDVLASNDGTLVAGPIQAGPSPTAIASGAIGDRLAVGDQLTGAFRRFDVDATAPTLAPNGGSTAAGFTVRDLVFDGDGRRLWIATDSQLVTFDLAGDVPRQVDQIAIGPAPARLATDPAGRFLVLTDAEDDFLRVYLVGPNTNDPLLGLGSPFDLSDIGDPDLGAGAATFEPGGRHLFVAMAAVGELRSYQIGPFNGTLQFNGTATGLGRPIEVIADPSGALLFVADSAGPALHLVTVDPKGVPTTIDSHALTDSPRRMIEADGGVQLIGANGTWSRFGVVANELVEQASAATGIGDPIDFAPLTVWVEVLP
jgi:6-phosphogluconolactonase (cycloisomerase 2 family)